MTATATPKQIGFLMRLAGQKGLSTEWMDSSWKPYTTMKQRSGKVRDFLASLSVRDASQLIDRLK